MKDIDNVYRIRKGIKKGNTEVAQKCGMGSHIILKYRR